MAGEDTLRFLDECRHRALVLAADLRYDSGHAWHLHLLALYGSILEMAHSIVVLARQDAPVGVPVILRSMLEAGVDVRNLARDARYGYWLEANALDERIKFKTYLENDPSPTGALIRGLPGFTEDLARDKARREAIAADSGNKNQRNVFSRFDRAGAHHEYATVYAGLCSAAHNDSAALGERHVVENGEGGPLQFHRDVSLDDQNERFGIALSIVINSTVDVHQVVESRARERVAELNAEYQHFVDAAR